MTKSTSNAKREWSRAIGAIAVIILLLLMFVGFVMLFGAVRGEEFSPTKFSRRSFVFYRIPIVRIQITPVMRTATTGALESHLATEIFSEVASRDGNIEPDEAESNGQAAIGQRWDIVRVRPISRAPEIGSAYSLCAYLDRQQKGKLKWLSWTKKHPELARALWPVVRQAALDRLYFCIPDLMSAAEHAAQREFDAGTLQDELEQIASEAAGLRNGATGADANRAPISREKTSPSEETE